MRNLRATAAAVVFAVGLLTQGGMVASAHAAQTENGGASAAKKCDTKQVYYYLKNGYEAYIGTNLYSDWLEGPGRITYQKTATSESNSSWSGDLGVSVNVVIAEIKSTYAKTVGKSHSVSDSWSYSAEVPKGQVRRLHQLKQSWSVQVVTWRYTTSDCKKTKELSNKRATFPVKNHDYMWILVGQS